MAVSQAVLRLEPRDGAVRALVGGYDFFRSEFNRAVQARRQPGSTFKTFVLTAAVERGMDVFLLNRGTSTSRPVPGGSELLTGDAHDIGSLRAAVGDREFDVVADFRAFTPADVQSRLEVLSDRMGQYVFISSASAYQTPPARLPVVESTPISAARNRPLARPVSSMRTALAGGGIDTTLAAARLIYERQDKGAIPALADLAARSPSVCGLNVIELFLDPVDHDSRARPATLARWRAR